MKKKVHNKIEYYRYKIQKASLDLKALLREEIEEYEILLYGKRGLRYRIDRLEQLLYGEVEKHWFNELRGQSHALNNIRIFFKGSYSSFVIKNLIKSISQIGIINIIKLALHQMKVSNEMRKINSNISHNDEFNAILQYRKKEKLKLLREPKEEEGLTSYERFNKAVQLKEPDRIPITPLMDYFYAANNNMSSKEFVLGPIENLFTAVRNTYAKFEGKLDMVHLPMGRLYAFYNILPLGPSGFYNELDYSDEIPSTLQFIEKGYIKTKDLKKIKKLGLRSIWRPVSNLKILETQADFLKIGKYINYWEHKKHVPIYATSGIVTPLEGLCYLMGIKNWAKAIRKHKEELREFCELLLDSTLANDYVMYSLSQVKRTYICLERVSPMFISPNDFEELVLHDLREIVKENVRNGLTTVFHMDTDWTPFFHYFLEFPKNGKYILHLEDSDIFKAKEMLGSRFCIMGNIQTKFLRFGTEQQIIDKTKELIEGCKEGGGYMMAEGCEVAPDTPFKNLKIWVETTLKYGAY